MSCTSEVAGMVLVNLRLGLVHRMRYGVTEEGQEKCQRLSSGFGNCTSDKPGEPEAGLQKAVEARWSEHRHSVAGRKGTRWWCFSLLGISTSLSYWKWSLILDMMGVWRILKQEQAEQPFCGRMVWGQWEMVNGNRPNVSEREWFRKLKWDSESLCGWMAGDMSCLWSKWLSVSGTWLLLKQQSGAGLVCMKEDVSERCRQTAELLQNALMQLLPSQNTAWSLLRRQGDIWRINRDVILVLGDQFHLFWTYQESFKLFVSEISWKKIILS